MQQVENMLPILSDRLAPSRRPPPRRPDGHVVARCPGPARRFVHEPKAGSVPTLVVGRLMAHPTAGRITIRPRGHMQSRVICPNSLSHPLPSDRRWRDHQPRPCTSRANGRVLGTVVRGDTQQIANVRGLTRTTPIAGSIESEVASLP